jgi:hypothetical protein
MTNLDFTADTPPLSMKHTFWLYWTTTAPLTVAVIADYAVFQRATGQKYRREDTDLDDEWDVKSLELLVLDLSVYEVRGMRLEL